MQLQLQDLDCGSLDLTIPGKTPSGIALRFDHITDGRGVIGTGGDGTDLDGLSIRELMMSILSLPLGDRAALHTTTPAMLSNVTLDGRVHHGLTGTLRFGLINTERVAVETSVMEAQFDLRAEEVSLVLEGDGGRTRIGVLALKNGHTNAGGFDTRLGSLSVTGFKVGWLHDGYHIEALKAHAHGIATVRDNVSLEIQGVDLSDGFQIADGSLEIPQLLIGRATLVIDDLTGEARAAAAAREAAEGDEAPAEPDDHGDREGPPAAEEPRAAAPEETPLEDPNRLRFDPGILDTVNGQLDVDLTMAATVPVIGRRRATHHFRIPIDGGIINYRELERDLSDLEDAFIDITLRGRSLVLERDIPFIPGFQKPILIWDLSEGDVGLAGQYLVRLRTIPHFRMPGSDGGGKKSKFKLHRLDFDNLAVGLSIDDAALLTSGTGSLRASVDQLGVSGNLHYIPNTEHEETSLALTAQRLTAVARELILGGKALHSAELRIGSIENATLTFEGLTPRRLEVTLRNVQLNNLALEL